MNKEKDASKNIKNPPGAIELIIERLVEADEADVPKLFTELSAQPDDEVLEKLAAALAKAKTATAFHNIHDVFVMYGQKSVRHLESLYSSGRKRSEVIECIIFSLFDIGEKQSARDKIVKLYEDLKKDDTAAMQLIVDMFEFELLKNAVDAAAEYINRGYEQKIQLIESLMDFFEEHLEIEARLRQQNDSNSRTLIAILDEVSDGLSDLSISRDGLEFFKFEDFITAIGSDNIKEAIFCYEISNAMANFITRYKEENDIEFLGYTSVGGFVFGLSGSILSLIKKMAAEPGSILCDLDAPADDLFEKDSHKNQFEKMYSAFWEDMRLIYGGPAEPTNIDYFAWKTACLVHSAIREFVTRQGGIFPSENCEDDSLIRFIFDVSEEIVSYTEEFVSCSDEGLFRIDDETVKFYEELLKQPKTPEQ